MITISWFDFTIIIAVIVAFLAVDIIVTKKQKRLAESIGYSKGYLSAYEEQEAYLSIIEEDFKAYLSLVREVVGDEAYEEKRRQNERRTLH